MERTLASLALVVPIIASYAAGRPPPPAALVATRLMEKDPRLEPRYNERVPYVVVAGDSSSRLIDLVMHPSHFLVNQPQHRINHLYYITKQVIPALGRLFACVGVDLGHWWFSMPRTFRTRKPPLTTLFTSIPSKDGVVLDTNPFVPVVSQSSELVAIKAQQRIRIDQYYLAAQCPLCDAQCRPGSLCDDCLANGQLSIQVLVTRLQKVTKECLDLRHICTLCCSTPSDFNICCASLDCSVIYSRLKSIQHQRLLSLFINNLKF